VGCLLGKREPVIDADFEDAAARAPQAYVRSGLQLEHQLPRLTGARLIASLAAIFDFDLHWPLRPLEEKNGAGEGIRTLDPDLGKVSQASK